jgi:hypothetical protein
VLAGYIHNDPNGGLSGIVAALSRFPREASMPRAAAVRRHVRAREYQARVAVIETHQVWRLAARSADFDDLACL